MQDKAACGARSVLSGVLLIATLLLLAACGGSSSGGNPPPPPANYTIGGTVSGLSGSGLVLQNNGGNNLAVAANKTSTILQHRCGWWVLSFNRLPFMTQPSNPDSELRRLQTAAGRLTPTSRISRRCAPPLRTPLAVQLQVYRVRDLCCRTNVGNDLSISANGGFTFTAAVPSGGAYNVTVLAQPSNPAQACVVSNGSGTAAANVTNVQVTCTVVSGTFTATGSLVTGRYDHTATALPNGKVLIVGGEGDGNPGPILSSAELSDPSTGIFTATGSLASARSRHTATLLPNGKVLIARRVHQRRSVVVCGNCTIQRPRDIHSHRLDGRGEVLPFGDAVTQRPGTAYRRRCQPCWYDVKRRAACLRPCDGDVHGHGLHDCGEKPSQGYAPAHRQGASCRGGKSVERGAIRSFYRDIHGHRLNGNGKEFWHGDAVTQRPGTACRRS